LSQYEDGIFETDLRERTRERPEVEKITMRAIWITNAVLMMGMTLSGAALLAQQATAPAQATQDTTTQAGSTAKPQLTPEQKKQLRDLRNSARDQAAIIRNDQSLNAEQKEAKLKALHASTRQQMKSVLTPEQQTAIAERRAQAKANFAAKLGLTADQQTKLKGLRESTRQQRQAVLDNTALTNEQKQAQLSQIRQSAQSQLATILTPDQLEKFHQMRRHGRKQG
jgi:Spy/CpxP family protein refolding chaperone